MDKIDLILRFVAQQMEKSDSHFEKWTVKDRLLMDFAVNGECIVICRKEIPGGPGIEHLITMLRPLSADGSMILFRDKKGAKGFQFIANADTGMALMKRFQEWERRNADALAPHPHTRRLEWYRQDLILRFA